jgi:c(7)-type cytochrome triheme protein
MMYKWSKLAGAVLLAALVLLIPAAEAQKKEAPKQISYTAKNGDVVFDHAKHVERVENKCETCHDKLFPQARGELNYKQGLHRPAEAKKISCAGCHVAGGMSFESKGNCNKCHVKK